MKQVEKKHEVYQNEAEEVNKSVNSSSLALGGRKLLLTSITETFKRSVDTIVKRIDSHMYFSTIRH